MKNVLKLISLALVLGSGVIASASAAVIYDENISGDVSDSLPGTTLGALSLGTSTVIGNLPGNFDDDWFEFTIAAGLQLDGIIISAFTEVSGAGNGGNLGFSPGGLNAAGPFTAAQIGQDVLDITGPTTTLGPGTYSVKAGTGSNQNTYAFDFVVSSINVVPEPASLALLGLGLAGLGFSRRKKA